MSVELPEWRTEEYKTLTKHILETLVKAGFGVLIRDIGIYIYIPLPSRAESFWKRLREPNRTDVIGFLWLINDARSASLNRPVLDYTDRYFEQCKTAAKVLAEKTGLNIRLNQYSWDNWEVDRHGRLHDKLRGD